MKYGFCEQAVVPVRSQPGEQQEMTNQLLYGDLVFVKDSLNDWLLIETSNDNYEGWIDKKQIQIIDQNIFKDHQKEHPIYSLELCSNAVSDSKKALRLTMGARLPNYSNGHFQIKDQLYYFTGNTSNPKEKAGNKQIVQTAQNYLGSPYLWGGRSPFGIDCSGFTQIVFKMCGSNCSVMLLNKLNREKPSTYYRKQKLPTWLFLKTGKEILTTLAFYLIIQALFMPLVLLGSTKLITKEFTIQIQKNTPINCG